MSLSVSPLHGPPSFGCDFDLHLALICPKSTWADRPGAGLRRPVTPGSAAEWPRVHIVHQTMIFSLLSLHCFGKRWSIFLD